MLNYTIKLEKIKTLVLYFLKKEVSDIYHIHHSERELKFNNFITNIAVYYVTTFHEEFYEYINYDTTLQLECAARHIGYALKTYFKVHEHFTLSNIESFTSEFLNTQFEDFDKWCYDLYPSYCEEQNKKNL